MKILSELSKLAAARLVECPNAQQVVIVQTADGVRYYAESKNILLEDHTEEDALLADLGKRPVAYLVCMWEGQFLDVPSEHLRQGLMKANPKNREAQVLLRGERGLSSRTLKELQ